MGYVSPAGSTCLTYLPQDLGRNKFKVVLEVYIVQGEATYIVLETTDSRPNFKNYPPSYYELRINAKITVEDRIKMSNSWPFIPTPSYSSSDPRGQIVQVLGLKQSQPYGIMFTDFLNILKPIIFQNNGPQGFDPELAEMYHGPAKACIAKEFEWCSCVLETFESKLSESPSQY